jgi:hypothetical protein
MRNDTTDSFRHFAALATASFFLAVSPRAGALAYTCAPPNMQRTFTTNAAPGTTNDSIQSFVSPAREVIIDATGAQGGRDGGLGAEVVAAFAVESGSTICMIIGIQGETDANYGSGGGGATFVYSVASGTCESNLPDVNIAGTPQLMIAAAGGGGGIAAHVTPASSNGVAPSGGGAAGAAPGASGVAGGAGGTAGSGGGGSEESAAGGGGWLTDGGIAPQCCLGGLALVHGSVGGTAPVFSAGGFGGGGSGANGGAGGGGFNGGGAGGIDSLDQSGAGGGGGSFSSTAPLLPYTQGGVQTGNGAVTWCFDASTPVRLQEFGVD